MAEEHSLASRYCTILEELKKEALQDYQEMSDIRSDNTPAGAGDMRQPYPSDATDSQRYLPDEQISLLPENNMAAVRTAAVDVNPEDFHDIFGWSVFDSMVSSLHHPILKPDR